MNFTIGADGPHFQHDKDCCKYRTTLGRGGQLYDVWTCDAVFHTINVRYGDKVDDYYFCVMEQPPDPWDEGYEVMCVAREVMLQLRGQL